MCSAVFGPMSGIQSAFKKQCPANGMGSLGWPRFPNFANPELFTSWSGATTTRAHRGAHTHTLTHLRTYTLTH
eukprot:5052215-Alexandrium_andersonii.AAC.1